jgi:hypothetical protein
MEVKVQGGFRPSAENPAEKKGKKCRRFFGLPNNEQFFD